jgi:hypothetical protein
MQSLAGGGHKVFEYRVTVVKFGLGFASAESIAR